MLDRLKSLMRSFRTRGQIHKDMDEEMRFHIEQYQADLIRKGVPPSEAAWRARREFGNIALTQENCRQAKGLPVFDELIRNGAYALRQLRRAPGFAAAVILTLGLCIGVNTAVFGVIDAVLLRSIPYPQPERLIDLIREVKDGSGFFASARHDGAAWEALKGASTILVAAKGGVTGVNMGAGNRAFYVHQERVSVRYFSVLGIPLGLGREFDESEDRAGGPDAVVLSNALWKRFFNSDPSIVGRTILLRGSPYLVTGVTSESFVPRAEVDLWTPLRPSMKGEGGGTNYSIIARLSPGRTMAEAQSEVRARGQGVYDQKRVRLNIAPFEKSNQEALRERLMILWAAAGVVLLIGCVNIATLMLARGAVRRREMGTRLALGGGPGPLIRQLTTEALVLGGLGGLAGLAFGTLALQAIQTAIADFGIWQPLRLDGRVLLVTGLITLAVSLLSGLAPAFQAARVDVRTTLLEGGSRAVAGGGSHWFRRALVLSEVALCLMLLVGAGLLIRTLLHLENLNPGFDGTNVLSASASLQDARYQDSATINRLFRDTLDAIRGSAGVQSAAVALHVPYQQWLNTGVTVRASGGVSRDREVGTSVNYVTPGYFEVLRIPLRAGRVIELRDAEGASPVALVNDTFVRKFLKGADPLNSYLVSREGSRQIVGVVSDVQQLPGLAMTGPIVQEPAVYIPATQFSTGNFQMAHTWYAPSWIVRASGPREQVAQEIEQAIARVDPLLPVARFRSMLDERNSALKSQRTNAWLLGVLAALAVSLALVGVYGIVANSVVERTREFGIRMALGSSLARVIRDAIMPGIALASGGVVIGAALAAVSVKVLKGLLYGVQPIDLETFLSMAVLLIGVSALASLWPALTLARLDPSSVLRQD